MRNLDRCLRIMMLLILNFISEFLFVLQTLPRYDPRCTEGTAIPAKISITEMATDLMILCLSIRKQTTKVLGNDTKNVKIVFNAYSTQNQIQREMEKMSIKIDEKSASQMFSFHRL